MKKLIKQAMTIVLIISFCITAMPTKAMETAITEREDIKLTLSNVGKKKTLYQYLEFIVKANVDNAKCQFESSNKNVATVNKNGVITAKKKGTATISVTYGGQKQNIKLTVKKSGKNYSPKRVEQIANQRIKKAKNNNGDKYTYMPDWLDQQLRDGEITKEEYDKYYPNCGGGNYLIIHYTTRLDTLWKLGTRLKTESQIANDISGYYEVSNWDYYYVEYVGKKKRSGKMYHVFHLYN